MNTHTSIKIKLKKQIFLIDIFYDNYKENLYNIFTKRHPSITKTDYPFITKTEGFIIKDHYIKHNAKI